MTRLLQLAARQTALPGILGGLGPLAHIQFEHCLIEQSARRGACCDQDHPVWIVVSGTEIPDRTQSLKGETQDCTPWIIRYAQLLEAAGVDFLVVTCNTAHAFYDRVQPQLKIPWIHLMVSTTEFITHQFPRVRRVGILATDGTLQTRLYHQSLAQAGLTPVSFTADSAEQNQIMQAIYHPEWGIKSTGNRVSQEAQAVLQKAAYSLNLLGAEILIAGCTELSVGLSELNLSLPWVDPLAAIAEVTLDLAFGQRPLYCRLVA